MPLALLHGFALYSPCPLSVRRTGDGATHGAGEVQPGESDGVGAWAPLERSLKTGVTAVTVPPIGCFTFDLSAPGLGQATQRLCVEGATRYGVDFVVTEPDGTAGREGCSLSGCADQFVCQADGICG